MLVVFLAEGGQEFSGSYILNPHSFCSKVECANVNLSNIDNSKIGPSHLRRFVHLNRVEEHLKENLKGLI